MSVSVVLSLLDADIQTRPNAGPGLWTCFLLPIAQLICAVKFSKYSSHTYKLTSICSFGLLITTCFFLLHCFKKKPFSKPSSMFLIPTVLLACIFHYSFDKGIQFSIYSSFFCTYVYYKVFLFILRTFPKCFTFGEAAICTQSILLLCYSTALNVYGAAMRTPTGATAIATLIIQIGLLAIGLICLSTYLIQCFRKPIPFYCLFGFAIVFWILLPLHYLLQRSPLLWIYQLFFDDIQTMKLVSYWLTCSTIAVYAIHRQIRGARKASTSVRKIFHLLAILAFVPGLLLKCTLLFVCSGVLLAFFIVLEMLRILDMPPMGEILQDGFFVFSDSKDAGNVAMTAIYLLAGCSLPMWIHPAPCDVTDSVGFNLLPLLSGLFIVGIGDTCSSFVGANIGKHFWKGGASAASFGDSKYRMYNFSGSTKTIEGTLACIFSQIIFFYFFMEVGLVIKSQELTTKTIISIIVASVFEAITDQVDNIVLPFLMFIMFLL